MGRKYKNPVDPVGSSIAGGKAFFEDLFVLELANNHLGSVERGMRMAQGIAVPVKKSRKPADSGR